MRCKRLQTASVSLQRVLHFTVLLHIHIKPPGNEYHKDYINNKLFPSIQMQAICDSTGRFLDVFIGYPGSVDDARVLRNSPIFCQALFLPAGWFLLGDGGYPCLEKPVGLLTPYIGLQGPSRPGAGQIQRASCQGSVCDGKSIWKDEDSLEGHPFSKRWRSVQALPLI